MHTNFQVKKHKFSHYSIDFLILAPSHVDFSNDRPLWKWFVILKICRGSTHFSEITHTNHPICTVEKFENGPLQELICHFHKNSPIAVKSNLLEE